MKTLTEYLSEYSESHQNLINQKIHKICVPLIAWSLLGMLYCIPFTLLGLNLAAIFSYATLIYYAQFKNWKVLLFALLMLAVFWLVVNRTGQGILGPSFFIFAFGWVAQFYGHKIEGKKPSFLKDLFFLLIGPLWVCESGLNKFGWTLKN